MALLSATNKERIKFHLSYTSDAVPSGDFAILNSRLDADYAAEQIDAIATMLARISRVWTNSEVNQQEAGVFYNRILTGDVNRTDREDRAEPYKLRRRAYLDETDRLALYFGVRNYTNPANHQHLHWGTVRQ